MLHIDNVSMNIHELKYKFKNTKGLGGDAYAYASSHHFRATLICAYHSTGAVDKAVVCSFGGGKIHQRCQHEYSRSQYYEAGSQS